MYRSSSEWAFQKFIEEVLNTMDGNDLQGDVADTKTPQPFDLPPTVQIGSDEYHALLKHRLDIACAAVARSRESHVNSQQPVVSDDQKQTSLPPESVDTGPAHSPPIARNTADPLTHEVPALPDLLKKPAVQVRSTSSGSSRDQSDDEELEGETDTTGNMDPADDKRARRMRSNRESARRSRRRKQEQLNELETQAAQLRVEKSSLLQRLSDVNQKYSEAAVDNRVLKADVETLRAKVMMAEDKVKRVTGLNPPFPAFPAEIPDPPPGMSFDGTNPHQLPNPSTFPQPHYPIVVPVADPHDQILDSGFPTSSVAM